MRKKIIKSYFFNDSVKNPATSSLFCFSKRAFKQSKQQRKTNNWIQNTRKSKKTLGLIKYYNQYKNNINTKINLNQWVKNDEKIILFFLKSYYFNKKLITKLTKYKKYSKKQLKLWVLFKNKFFKNLKNRLAHYPKTGVLSSHYVHILSRKNLTYQTRSKYRSKTPNLNFFNHYFYFFTKFIHMYVNSINTNLYYFSTNVTYKTIWVDEDFYTNTSEWHNNSLSIKKKTYMFITRRHTFYTLFNINTNNQDNTVVLDLYKNKTLINSFFLEEEPLKKDLIYTEITSVLSINTLNYIHLINMFIFSTYTKNYKNNLLCTMLSHVSAYNRVYNI